MSPTSVHHPVDADCTKLHRRTVKFVAFALGALFPLILTSTAAQPMNDRFAPTRTGRHWAVPLGIGGVLIDRAFDVQVTAGPIILQVSGTDVQLLKALVSPLAIGGAKAPGSFSTVSAKKVVQLAVATSTTLLGQMASAFAQQTVSFVDMQLPH